MHPRLFLIRQPLRVMIITTADLLERGVPLYPRASSVAPPLYYEVSVVLHQLPPLHPTQLSIITTTTLMSTLPPLTTLLQLLMYSPLPFDPPTTTLTILQPTRHPPPLPTNIIIATTVA
eukprot:GFYU01050314.1.p2 GENE.GFYU01050314.1~~GFYU01050314.1.p2  ORF type:complete len:119 (+),score=7.56 GFYU01050314.1:188-544(+)